MYYHGTVIPLGAYVVESNEEMSWAGDKAHECLLGKFREVLRESLGCEVVEIVAGFGGPP